MKSIARIRRRPKIKLPVNGKPVKPAPVKAGPVVVSPANNPAPVRAVSVLDYCALLLAFAGGLAVSGPII